MEKHTALFSRFMWQDVFAVGMHATHTPRGVGTMGHTPTPSRFGATFMAGGGGAGGQLKGRGGGGSGPLHIWLEMAASSRLSL